MKRSGATFLLTPSEQLLFNQLGVRIRFGLLAPAFLALGVAYFALAYPGLPYAGLVTWLLFVLVYNSLGGIYLFRPKIKILSLQRSLTLLDQLALTMLFALLGGLEAFVLPLFVLASFMISINTDRKESYVFAGTLIGMFGVLLLLQFNQYIPYNYAGPAALMGFPTASASPFASTWTAVGMTWSVMAGFVLCVVYFANFVKEKFSRVVDKIILGQHEITNLRKLSADILDLFPFAVLTVNSEGKVEAFNPAAIPMLGAYPGWLGRPFEEIEELNETGLSLYFARAMHGEKLHIQDFPYLRQPGKEKTHLSVSAISSYGADGELEQVLFCLEDVTERLRREEQQRELQQVLLQTEKMASLGQLAAGVAHELNNPLTAIDANVQMLQYRLRQAQPIGEESRQRIERIAENSDRIRILVKNLLSYARPAPETSALLDLHAIIEEALRFCEHVVRNAGIEVVKEFATDLPRIYGNRTQLQQVFVNLLTNAVQASPAQSGPITLRTEHGEGDIRFEVEDNGSGIDLRDAERIFDPFFTTKSDGDGTGLGLSIVQTIVQKHGGRISATSKAGKGTIFRIVLPIPEASPPSKAILQS